MYMSSEASSDRSSDANITTPLTVSTPVKTPAWWMGRGGDLVAAAAVLLGGILLGGALFHGPEVFGPPERPPFWGPTPQEPGARAPGSAPASAIATLTLLVVPAGLMFLRRRWPLLVFSLVLTGFISAVLFNLPSLSPGIAATIAAYAFAFRAPRKVVLWVISGATGLLVLLALAVAGWDSLDTRVFQIGAALAIAAALADSARSRHAYLRQVEDRAERAEQTRELEARRRVADERLRIARDLHDTVAHQISVINLHAGAASGYLNEQPARAQVALRTIREAARDALGEIGGLLRYLRDDEHSDLAPHQEGLDELETLLARLRELGLEINTDVQGDLSQFTGLTNTVAYRVIQEGLTNAHKHGSASTAQLSIQVDPKHLRIVIANAISEDSPDTDTTTKGIGTGLGLIGLRERVAVVGGHVWTHKAAGQYRLEVELPWQREEDPT